MDINPLLSLCGIGPFSTNEVLSPKLFIFHGFVNNNLEDFIKSGLSHGPLGNTFKQFIQFIPREKIVWHYYYRDNNIGHSLTLTNYARLLTIHGNVPSCYHYDFWIPDNFIVKLQKIYDMNTSDTPFDEIKIPDIYIIDYLVFIQNQINMPRTPPTASTMGGCETHILMDNMPLTTKKKYIDIELCSLERSYNAGGTPQLHIKSIPESELKSLFELFQKYESDYYNLVAPYHYSNCKTNI